MPSMSLASYFRGLFSCRPFNLPSFHPFGELFLCRPFLGRVIFVHTILLSILRRVFCADHITVHPSFWRVIFVPIIPWASYFRADHLIVLSVYPFGELFSCHPSLGESYFRANHLILHPLASLCRLYNSPPIHPFGELFLCRPSLGRAIFVPII